MDTQYILPFEIERVSAHTTKVSHPYIHCRALNLTTLLRIACAGHDSQIDNCGEITLSMMNTASLLLYKSDVTPLDLARYLVEDSSAVDSDVQLRVYDARDSHLLAFDALFEHFSRGELFIADIHDLTHHGAQTLNWHSFVVRLGDFGVSAYTSQDLEKKELANFLLYACLEYAIVQGSRHAYSAGCLNWQSPRKSIAETASFRPMCAQCITSWNSVRGVNSLHRRLSEASQKLNRPLDWLDRLGYTTPVFIDNMFPTKYSSIPSISGPKSIDQLLSSAIGIMDSYANV